jgi:hypothetical protein
MKTLVSLVCILLATAAYVRAESDPRGRGVEFQRIASRVFEAARYDAMRRELTIVFANGVAYAYRDVPREVYLDFTRIVNKGEYFAARIRNRYPVQRVEQYPLAWSARE